MPVNFPLVGRREELDLIEQSFSSPSLAGLVLAGEAGVGKTRLAHEAISLAERRHLPVAWGSATQAGRNVPFGAVAHLLPSGLPGGFTREDVIRAAGTAITERFDGSRPVLAIDDAHLLDDHSAVLMLHLAQSGGAFVVASMRSGEEAPDPIMALWKDELCERLEIQALSEAEVGELLERALGGQVDMAASHRLWEEARGNPLYLRELFVAGLETGALTESEGIWTWQGRLAHSPRLRELIGDRIGRLSAEHREVLEMVAAAEPVGVRLLETLVPAELVEALEASSLLEEQRDDRRASVRLAHPLYAELLRAETSPARTRALIGRLAGALETTAVRRRDDVLRLATWNLEAGRPTSPEDYLAAAGQALTICDFGLAERLARAAAEAGAGTPATFLLAQALMGVGRFDEAERVLAALDESSLSELERTRAATARAQNLFWNRAGTLEKSLEILARAESAITDPRLGNEIAATGGYFLFISGRPDEAIERGRALLGQDLSEGALTMLLGTLGQALQFSGNPEESLELWDRIGERALPEIQKLPFAPVAATVYAFWAHFFAGRFEQAGSLAEEAYRVARDREADWVRGFLACLAGIAARGRGRVATAARWGQEGVVPLRNVDSLGQLPLFLAELAQTLALLGRPDDAEPLLQEAETAEFQALGVPYLATAAVWIACSRGELSKARAIALETASEIGDVGLRSHQAILLHDVARLGEPETVVPDLERLADLSDSRWIRTFPIHARALANGDGPALMEVSRTFEGMGAMLLAAESTAEASDVFREEGRTGSALAAAERARALAAECEGARTPALSRIRSPLPITQREREIGGLAARGLTNRAIAERLVLSPRTVGNHLHNLYAKLGVVGREELVAVFEPVGTDMTPSRR